VSVPVSIETVIASTAEKLRAVSDSARLDAEMLVARAIDMPRSYLFAHPEEALDESALARLDGTVTRRLGGEPMAYIRGVREFWSLELLVTPATLVPRPETELLVELALREIPRDAGWPVLDLGTGCGAIALAIAHDRPPCTVTAVDLSGDALAVARENGRQLGLGNVEFLQGDWTAPVAGRRFRVVVSNPPYVRLGDPHLEALAAEPELALSAGEDGLDAIRTIARDAAAVLEPGGFLFLEHGAGQREPVAEILAAYGWQAIRCYDDAAGLPRATRALHPQSEKT
jgi:release factor glutamine methyltransferase